VEKLQTFHKTRQGYLAFGVLELVLAYILASIAIDTANMFAYVSAAFLTVGALINFINAIRSHRKRPKAN
jgi:hypothetical protein